MSDDSGVEVTSEEAPEQVAPETQVAPGGKEEGGKPDFLPEKFWNIDTNQPDIESLSKAYSEMGTKIREKREATRNSVMEELEADKLANRPESADKYELRIPDELAANMSDDLTFEFNEEDPLLNYWRDYSFNSGLSQDDFEKGISAFITSKFSELPVYNDEIAKLGDNGVERTQHVNRWAKKNLSDKTYAALERFAVTADGIMALEEVMQGSGEPSLSPSDTITAEGRTTLNELRAMQADPRYWDPNKRDEEFIKKVEKGYEKLVS